MNYPWEKPHTPDANLFKSEAAGGIDDPMSITVVTAPPGCHQTKDWTRLDADGKPTPAYPNVVSWKFLGVRFSDLDVLASALANAASDPHNAVIRGRLKDGTEPRDGWHASLSAKKHGDRITVIDAPRSWVCVEIDKVVQDPRDYQPMLPSELQGVDHVVQLSASAGFPGTGGIKAHLWFLTDRSLTSAECRRWLKGSVADLSILTPVGKHYVAPPLRGTMVDPFADRRIYVMRFGLGREMASPVVPEEAASIRASQQGPEGAAFVQEGAACYTDAYVMSLKPTEPVICGWIAAAARVYVAEQLADRNPTSTVRVSDQATLAFETKNVAEKWSDHCRDIGLAVAPAIRWGLLDADGMSGADWLARLCEDKAKEYGYPSGANGHAARSARRGALELYVRTYNLTLAYLAKCNEHHANQSEPWAVLGGPGGG